MRVEVDRSRAALGGPTRLDAQGQLHDPRAGQVEVGLGEGARVEGLDDPAVPRAGARRHLEVEPGVQARGPVGHGEPVADHQAGEPPLLAQHVGEQPPRLPGVLAVDEVVRRHDRPGRRLADDGLEGGEVELAQGALVDDRVEAHPEALLVVHREVLGTGADALGLDAAHQGHRGPAGQQRVLGEVLEAASPGRVALEVQPRAQQHPHVRGTRLPTQRPADLLDELDVPRRPQRHGRREAGGRRGVGEPDVVTGALLLAQPVRAVGQHDRRHPVLGEGAGVPEVGTGDGAQLVLPGQPRDHVAGAVGERRGRRRCGAGHGRSSRLCAADGGAARARRCAHQNDRTGVDGPLGWSRRRRAVSSRAHGVRPGRGAPWGCTLRVTCPTPRSPR